MQKLMRSKLLAALAALAIGAAGCGNPAPVQKPDREVETPVTDPVAAKPPDVATRVKALDALLDEVWEYRMRESPEWASMLGDHRYDDQWSDRSPETIAEQLVQARAFLTRFEAVDPAGFPEQKALDHRLMVRELTETLDDARFESWLMPIDQMSGPHIQLPQFASVLRFTTVEDYQNYATRLDKVPVVFDQTIALMKAGLAKGLIPPQEQLILAAKQTTDLSKAKAATSPFAAPVAKFPDGISKEDQERLRALVMTAIEDKVLPAYRTLAAFLTKEYAPAGRKDPGVWSLPDGEARYASAVAQSTTTKMTPDEIHELGVAEVARIEAEQAAIGKTLGFKSLAAFRKHIRSSKKLYAKSAKDILARYQRHTDAMYEKLPELFGRLPEQKMVILATESFRDKDAAGAEYMPGAPDGSRPGMVRVNTSSPKKRLWIDMESTAYHEGVPGHHMQLTIQQELPEIAKFRKFGGYNSFAEGWALYSERLGKDVGFFQDPYSDYGRLQDEMMRAIRLVVDTGLHHKKWTRQQVVDYFHAHSTIDEPSVQIESNRYIVWPAQALAYKVGQLTILRLRDEARAAIGDAFDIRAFHDQILGAGALPLDVLEERLDAWTAAGAASGGQ